jgi:hypothetical protein
MIIDWYYGCYMWVNFDWMVWLKGRMDYGLGFLIILISSYNWDLLLSSLHSWVVTNWMMGDKITKELRYVASEFMISSSKWTYIQYVIII